MKSIYVFGLLYFLFSYSLTYGGSAIDVAYERVALRLELIRNQLELTLENHSNLIRDINRQERELQLLRVFEKIPVVSSKSHPDNNDKNDNHDNQVLSSQREEIKKHLSLQNIPARLLSLRFPLPWKKAPYQLPSAIPFDRAFRIPEDQLVDQRKLEITFAFSIQLHKPRFGKNKEKLKKAFGFFKKPSLPISRKPS